MSYEKKSSWKPSKFSSEEHHREGDRSGRRTLSSKLAPEGENKRQARRAFFTERQGQGNGYSKENKGEGRREYTGRPERKSFSREEKSSWKEDRSNRPFNEAHRDEKGRFNHERKSYGEGFHRESGERSRRTYGGYSRRESGERQERPRYIEDSRIIDEIVRKRKFEGRSPERRPKVLSLEWNEERGLIRLNKYIANAGVCSRREADKLIEAGAVTVNGEVVTELGTKIMPTDEVRYGDQVLQREKPVYILLNKPKDFITTTSDEFDRKNVMNLVAGACPQRVYPVGRLDRNTTGLLLITNDGELAKKLTHPRYGVKKIYHVELDKNLSQEDFEQIITGVELNDGFIAPDELAYVGETRREVGITLHSGKNRIVRRIFEHLGYEVVKLDRVYYAGLTKKDLPRGRWRFLREDEVNILKMSL